MIRYNARPASEFPSWGKESSREKAKENHKVHGAECQITFTNWSVLMVQ